MNTKRIIRIFLTIFLIFTNIIILAIYSKYDYKIYNYPRSENGIIEFVNDKNVSKRITLHPLGDVEFYYNRWIITDNDTSSYDSLLRVPSKWSDSINNDVSYPKKGYGSYKITLKNLTPGSMLQLDPTTLTVAANCYFNNELIGIVGSPSKTEPTKSFDLKKTNVIDYIVPESGIVEFVIECGYSNYGGLNVIPPIKLDTYDSSYMNFVSYGFGIALGLLIFAITIGIIFTINKNEKFLLLPTLITLYIHYLFSYDSLQLLRKLGLCLNYSLTIYITFVTSIILILNLIYYLYNIKYIKINLKKIIITITISIIMIVTYPFIMFTHFQIIPWILIGIIIIILLGKIIKHFWTDNTINWETLIFFTIISTIICQAMDNLDIISISSYGFTSISVIVASLIALCVYISKIVNLYKSEKLKDELEIKNLKYKQELLLKQIKPHFIYNSLGAIMSLYHQDINEGDKGIIIFSKYLRANVDSIDSGMVPFSDEIDNIINYVDLENLCQEDKFNLILNIKYDDFSIPLLSLQPIIENSIKYSGVNKKENGYIKISSELIDDVVVITISNNGIPFNTTNILSKSKGLSNIKERFKILLNAETTIISNEEETKTIIKFKRSDTFESNNS